MLDTPEFARDNSLSLASLIDKEYWTITALSRKTGISYLTMQNYVIGYQVANKEDYNKLADIFGWQKWED